jgi:uncharacterized membrane protein
MVDKNQIAQWLREGTINQTQARKMLADTTQHKKDKSSNDLIVALSTIGAILLGIGVILFVASNWEVIPEFVKTTLMIASTFGAYTIGYLFRYKFQNLPRVGDALIFLGALLFGATVFLIAQIYNVNANSHILVLIWLLSILPLVYSFLSIPIAALSGLLFYLWVSLFIFRNVSVEKATADLLAFPILFLVSGVALFGIGAMHYFSDKLKQIARLHRLIGLQIALFSLFLLTFRFFSGYYGGFNFRGDAVLSSQFTLGLVFLAATAVVLMAINLLFNPSKSETSLIESAVGTGLVGMAMITLFFPATTNIYVLLYNLILIGVIFGLFFVGYRREDMVLVNVGMVYLTFLILVRYFDFFWDLLPRALFFIVGGLVLVLGGIAMERQRKQLKEKFRS